MSVLGSDSNTTHLCNVFASLKEWPEILTRRGSQAKAFDTVWVDGLIKKLRVLNCPSHLVIFSLCHLRDRCSNRTSKQPHPLSVAYGGRIFPVLLSLDVNDMPVLPPRRGMMQTWVTARIPPQARRLHLSACYRVPCLWLCHPGFEAQEVSQPKDASQK